MALIERNTSSSSDFTQDTLGLENCDDQPIVVFFKTFRDEMLSLKVLPIYTVMKVKIMLSQLTKVRHDQIRLSLFGYGKLDEKKTLKYYYIQNGGTIVLKFRSSRSSISAVGQKLKKLTGKDQKFHWDHEDSDAMRILQLNSRPLTDAEMQAKYKELEKSQHQKTLRLKRKGQYRAKTVVQQEVENNDTSSVRHSNQLGSDSTYVAYHYQQSTFYGHLEK